MLDAVKSALQPDRVEQSPRSQTPEKQSADTDPAAVKTDADPWKDADKVPDQDRNKFKTETAARFDQLLTERKGLRDQLAAASTQLEATKHKVENYDRFNSFLVENKLTSEDVDNTFKIMALVRGGRSTEALKALEPIVAQLKGLAGEGDLPADLAEKVRLGYVDEATARETARLRAGTEQSNRQAEQARLETEQRRHTETVERAKSTGNEWEAAKRKADPDWHLKQDRIHELLELELRKGGHERFPKTDKDVVEILDGIYDKVTKDLRKFIPKPSSVKPPASGNASPRSVAQPTTMLEAIKASRAG